MPGDPQDRKRHLDLYAAAPLDRTITIGVRVAQRDEEGRRVLGPLEPREYRFPGELSIPTTIRLLNYEERTKAALAIPDIGDAERACQAIIAEAYEDIISLARALNPIEDDLELDINADQLLILLGWLAGKETVAEAIIDAITAGKTPEELAETLTQKGLAEEAHAGGGAKQGSPPLP